MAMEPQIQALGASIYARPESQSPEVTADSLDRYRSLVKHALDQLEARNPVPLESFANDISSETFSEENLVPVLRFLSREVTRLDNGSAAPLVQAVLSIPWSAKSVRVQEAFVQFLGLLASGIPKWWVEIAERVISEFTLPPSDTAPHHAIVKHVLRYIPTSAQKIDRILAKNFPHKLQEAELSSNYLSNLFLMAEYAPEHQRAIWALIVERLTQIDVEIDGEDEDVEADGDNDGDDEPGNNADDDDDDDSDQSSDDENDIDETEAPPAKRRRMDADEFADGEEVTEAELVRASSEEVRISTKLDRLLLQILEYLDSKLTPQSIEDGTATPLFIILRDTFNEFVVPTHTTRSVQFILFRAAHATPQYLDAYLVALIEMALDKSLDGEKRQKYMQYVSSFVARAKGLNRDQIVQVVVFLARWLDRYVEEREQEVDETWSMARFRMFYATSQALFYIFCFRHSALRIPGSDKWEADLDKLFQRLIISKFNPLKYCKSTVVAMFARIARKENVAYCFSILEQNRVGRFRSSSQQSSPSSTRNSGSGSLLRLSNTIWPEFKTFSTIEGYFPFDPLILRQARGLISRDYVEWTEVNSESDSDSASYSSSDDGDKDSSDDSDTSDDDEDDS